MRKQIPAAPALIVILAVVALVVTAYLWLDSRQGSSSKEPPITSALERIQRLTPEERKEIGRQAEEAAKGYGR